MVLKRIPPCPLSQAAAVAWISAIPENLLLRPVPKSFTTAKTKRHLKLLSLRELVLMQRAPAIYTFTTALAGALATESCALINVTPVFSSLFSGLVPVSMACDLWCLLRPGFTSLSLPTV